MTNRLTSRCVVLAADTGRLEQYMLLAERISPLIYAIKVHALVDGAAKEDIKLLHEAGYQRVWQDLKLHDTPDTVALRAAEAKENGADIITVHICGGQKMMEAAVKNGPPEILGITVLTSLQPDEAEEIYGELPAQKVLKFAHKAKAAGLHGLVCSPLEVASLATDPALSGMILNTPGIRSADDPKNDQVRASTPRQALMNGAHRLVIGRPITEAMDAAAVLDRIERELERAEISRRD